jgi:membrane protease YdiL (CAAX protease family)
MSPIFQVLSFKTIGFLNPILQIIFICFLFTVTVVIQRKEYNKTGKIYGRYPWRISTFLSSTYEEIIFRGLILFGLLNFFSMCISVTTSCVLFGLWHIKNYKWQTRNQTIYQVLYTGLFFGPIVCFITLWTGTIWVAVIVHYINNLLSSFIDRKVKTFNLKE